MTTEEARGAREVSEWSRITPERCDLCDQNAVWVHPHGGVRCNTCPRPEAKKTKTPSARPDGGVCRDCDNATVQTGACSTCTACGSTGGCG